MGADMSNMTINRGLRVWMLAAALMGVLSAPSHAKVYECNVKIIGEQTGWISEIMFLNISPDWTSVKLTDGLIQHYAGKDVVLDAKVVESTDKRFVFRWKLDARVQEQAIRMSYKATIFRDTMQISIFGNDGAYSGEDTGRGSCKEI
jgi:hypothetical protein